MPYYRAVGELPPKRHTQFRRPDGGLYAEELMGQEGFSSESALLYHRHLPTAIVSAADHPLREDALAPNHPLLPRHVQSPQGGRRPERRCRDRAPLLFGNGDVRVLYVVATETSPLYRNGIGDEVLYVESGSGVVETIFGALTATSGDYVVLPTSTTYRVVARCRRGPSSAGC